MPLRVVVYGSFSVGIEPRISSLKMRCADVVFLVITRKQPNRIDAVGKSFYFSALLDAFAEINIEVA